MNAETASLELFPFSLAGCPPELDDPWHSGAPLLGILQPEIPRYLEYAYAGLELPRR